MKVKFESQIYDTLKFNIIMNEEVVGTCSKEFINTFLSSYDKGYEKALYDTNKDLGTIKWLGSDEGWDLAIEAVQKSLIKKIEEKNKCN